VVLSAFGQLCAFANTCPELPARISSALNAFYQSLSHIPASAQKMPVKVATVTQGKEASIWPSANVY
jgi:hypothetical protein